MLFRHKKTIEDLHKQLEDAETTLRGFRAKLAAEKLDKENQKENLHKEFRAQLAVCIKTNIIIIMSQNLINIYLNFFF